MSAVHVRITDQHFDFNDGFYTRTFTLAYRLRLGYLIRLITCHSPLFSC